MNVYLRDLLQLRAEKSCVTLNPCDDTSTSSTIETLTILENVPESVVRECCSLLAYFLKLERGFESIDFANPSDLTERQIEQLNTINAVQNFTRYMDLCKNMIERVLENGRRVYALLEERTAARERAAKDGPNDHQHDPVHEDIATMHSLLSNMDGVFHRFYDMFVNNDCFPHRLIYEKLFVSCSLSERCPLALRKEHLDDLNTLFSTLSQAIVMSTDHCNSMFEAFFGTGILFTTLLNIMTNQYSREQKASQPNNEPPAANESNADRIRYWTRVRLLRPEDRASAHFIKDVNDPNYVRSVKRLTPDLFDRSSGMDIYLSKGDTLSTLFVQFVGRIFSRLYEWIERSDVKCYVRQHYVCENLQALFGHIGRGQDQRAWIRFFKRTHDRKAKVYIKIEPLLQLNDELIVGNEERTTLAKESTGTDPFTLATTTTGNGVQLRTTASADTARRYHLLRDFVERYNEFTCTRNDCLRQHWSRLRDKFAANSGASSGATDCRDDGDNILLSLDERESPLLSFESWCRCVNASLFPYNFLLLAANNDGVVERNKPNFNKETLDHTFTYKCQEYLLSKRFTSGKCAQILAFLSNLEIKSRLLFEEKNFLYLFSNAMENMPFLYDLFGETISEITTDQTAEVDLVQRDHSTDRTNDTDRTNRTDQSKPNYTKDRNGATNGRTVSVSGEQRQPHDDRMEID